MSLSKYLLIVAVIATSATMFAQEYPKKSEVEAAVKTTLIKKVQEAREDGRFSTTEVMARGIEATCDFEFIESKFKLEDKSFSMTYYLHEVFNDYKPMQVYSVQFTIVNNDGPMGKETYDYVCDVAVAKDGFFELSHIKLFVTTSSGSYTNRDFSDDKNFIGNPLRDQKAIDVLVDGRISQPSASSR